MSYRGADSHPPLYPSYADATLDSSLHHSVMSARSKPPAVGRRPTTAIGPPTTQRADSARQLLAQAAMWSSGP